MSARALPFFLAGAAVVLTAVSSIAAPPTLRIGSLNMEWLGQPEQRKSPYNVPQDPVAIADYLIASRVDVLAMQEVSDTDGIPSQRSNSILDRTFAIMHERGAGDWRYVLTPKYVLADKTQHVGIAWNQRRLAATQPPTKVKVEHRKYPHPTLDRTLSSWVRQPYAMKFTTGRGGTDFVMIALHLKSNVEGPMTEVMRRDEATTLAQQLIAVREQYADEDMILLGDTNCLSAQEPAAQVFVQNGFRDLNAADLRTYFSGAPFDRIFVPQSQREFARSVQTVFRPETGLQAYRTHISDHFLVFTDISVMQDDD